MEEQEKELNGYVDLGEISINCSNCGCPLVYVQKVKKTNRITLITAECPYCNDKSFETEVLGEFYIGPTEFVTHYDLDTEKDTNEEKFKVNIKTGKGTESYSY